MQLNLQIEGNYNIKDLDSGRLFEWSTVVSGLPWRHNQLAPHEPRMPPHEYVLRDWCEGEQAVLYEVAGFVIDSSPKSYDAYFRAYQGPMKYMEVGTEPGDFRYWRTSNLQPGGGMKHFLNRCHLDSVEPPRRVDQGAKPIPLREWGTSEPYWPKGAGFGEWRHEQGQWVFYPVSGN